MCWSAEVAAGFTVGELLLAVYLWRRNWSPRDRYVLPLALSVTMIEALEVVLWLDDPVPFTSAHSATCSARNVTATILAYLTLLLQPVLDGFFLFFTTDGGVLTKKSTKIAYWSAAIGMYLAGIGAFLHAHFAPAGSNKLDREVVLSADSLYSDSTCTFVGPNGHLLWQFSINDLLVPSTIEAGYFALSLTWLLYKPFKVGSAFFVLLNGMLAANMWYFRGSKESYSVWCWQAVAIYLFFIVEPYVLETPRASKPKAKANKTS
mmetsp:Transcript_16656/g.28108  ORF Transcript_16656/g.28108 Transcript_16656/m.28108 type:complete len:263 (+) Transcript_16656:381-1169(+)